MLEAIKQGEADPQVLAELAKGRLREKLPALRLALDGRVQAHHQLLIGELLDHLGQPLSTRNAGGGGVGYCSHQRQ